MQIFLVLFNLFKLETCSSRRVHFTSIKWSTRQRTLVGHVLVKIDKKVDVVTIRRKVHFLQQLSTKCLIIFSFLNIYSKFFSVWNIKTTKLHFHATYNILLRIIIKQPSFVIMKKTKDGIKSTWNWKQNHCQRTTFLACGFSDDKRQKKICDQQNFSDQYFSINKKVTPKIFKLWRCAKQSFLISLNGIWISFWKFQIVNWNFVTLIELKSVEKG